MLRSAPKSSWRPVKRGLYWLPLLITSCAGKFSPASFSGREESPIVCADAVRTSLELPKGYAALGHVSASCTLLEISGAVSGEPLSDIDCSEARLLLALRERAAAVGGDTLFEQHCVSRRPSESRDSKRTPISCEARVARPEESPLASSGASCVRGARGSLADDASGTDAWRIDVDFAPAPNAPKRKSRRADLVRQLAYVPVGDVPLGDVITHGGEGCSRDAVRDAVRVAAGRFGASQVAEVHCVRAENGWTCVGSASSYAAEPGSQLLPD